MGQTKRYMVDQHKDSLVFQWYVENIVKIDAKELKQQNK